MAGCAGCSGERWHLVRLLLRPLYGVLVRLSSVLLPLPDGLPLWSRVSLPLSAQVGAKSDARLLTRSPAARTGAKPGAGLCTGDNPTWQCADSADTAAAAVLIRRAHLESCAASERNAAMILSASSRAPGSWVRM